MIILNNLLKVNSILACIIAFLVASTIMLLNRKDLIPTSLTTSLLSGLFAIAFYRLVLSLFPHYLTSSWLLFNQPLEKTLLGISLTEILWTTSWGLVAGCFYEFWQGYTVIPLKSSQNSSLLVSQG